MLSGNFYGSGKCGIGFFGGLILVQGFFWVLFEALGIFWVLIFAPIRSFPSVEDGGPPPAPHPLKKQLPSCLNIDDTLNGGQA